MALSEFTNLFAGRTDAYGSWEGGCVKSPITQDLMMSHLLGVIGVGIYPVVDGVTRWGCSDIDVPDLDAVRNLQLGLSVKGIHAWVERSRRGYHLWVFASEPVPANMMRRCLMAVHQVCDYPAKEVNPKQDDTAGGYGNYVRLPYFGGWDKIPSERVVLDDQERPMSLHDFVAQATTRLAHMDTITKVANLWTEPPRPSVVHRGLKPMSFSELTHVVSPYVATIINNGPLAGSDRSTTLVRLAHKMREDGLLPGEALGLLIEADKRWGKFHDREDGLMHLESIIMRVFP